MNDTRDILDILADENTFKDIPKEIYQKYGSVLIRERQISEDKSILLENGIAYIVHSENEELVKERELTPSEYQILYRTTELF